MEYEIIDIFECAKRLGVSRPTVRNWVKRYGLPAQRIGVHTLKFNWVDVFAWYKERTIIIQQKGRKNGK